MKKSTKKIVISALTAFAFAGTSVATTFALFTDEAKTEVSIQAGKVNIGAQLVGMKTYSAAYDPAGDLVDEEGATYRHELQGTEVVEGVTHYLFDNDGYCTFANDAIKVVNITPGDKLEFGYDLSHNSNVAVKYRFVYAVADSNYDLVKGLTTTIKQGEEEAKSFQGLTRYASAWTVVEPEEELDNLMFTIELPINKGNIYQEKVANIVIKLQEVQANAYRPDGAEEQTVAEDLIDVQETVEGQSLTLVASNNNVAATVTIPANEQGVTDASERDVKIVVSNLVVDKDVSENESSIKFDVSLFVDNEPKESFDQDIQVEINVGRDLEIVSVKHKGSAITDYTYNPAEGIIRFTTKSFSPFEVVYYDLPNTPVRIGKVGYQSLAEAVAAAPAGESKTTIIVQQNLNNSVCAIPSNKNIEIDLGGKTLSYTGIARYSISYDGTSRNAFGDIFVNQGGKLTIKNGNLSGHYKTSNALATMIWNAGELNISNISCNVTGEVYPDYSSVYGSILNNMNQGVAIISGRFTCSTDVSPITNGSGKVTDDHIATLTIDGNETYVSCDAHSDAIDNFGKVIVNDGVIQGGTSTGNPPSHAVNSHNSDLEVTLEVYGGKLLAGSGNNDTPYSENVGVNILYGGTFNFEPKNVENHTELHGNAVANGDGTWSIVKRLYHVTADNSDNYVIDENGVKTQLTVGWSAVTGSGDQGDKWTLNPDTGKYEKPVAHGLAGEGDTVFFENGVYYVTGKLYVAHGVTLIGASRTGVFIGENGSSQESNFNCNGDVTIKNMTFLGMKKVYAITPNLEGLSSETSPTREEAMREFEANFIIENCDFRLRTGQTEKMYAINFQTYNGSLTVRNCYFNVGPNGIGLCGLRTNGGDRFVIEGNTFENCGSAIDYVGANFAENQSALWEAANTLNGCPINRF